MSAQCIGLSTIFMIWAADNFMDFIETVNTIFDRKAGVWVVIARPGFSVSFLKVFLYYVHRSVSFCPCVHF